jgi:hypothetical protein
VYSPRPTRPGDGAGVPLRLLRCGPPLNGFGATSSKDLFMSVLVLVLFFAVVAVTVGGMVAMFVRDKPFYGAMGLCVLAGPGTVLAFLYLPLA